MFQNEKKGGEYMDPMSLVSSAKVSIESALTAYKVYKGANDAIEGIEKGAELLEIKSNLLDAKDNVLELRAALIEKDEEIQKLKEELKFQKEVVYEEPVYWHLKENGEKDGPYCQKCYDGDNKLIRLQSLDRRCEGKYHCRVCNSSYASREYLEWKASQPKATPMKTKHFF